MNFPKNHMLSKYCEDIRQKGVIHNYSTIQTENQHKFDTKKPARKSNKQQSFNKKVSCYCYCRLVITYLILTNH